MQCIALAAAAAVAVVDDRVKPLPGLVNGSVDGQFAGHVMVNESRGAHLFYYFLPSERASRGHRSRGGLVPGVCEEAASAPSSYASHD